MKKILAVVFILASAYASASCAIQGTPVGNLQAFSVGTKASLYQGGGGTGCQIYLNSLTVILTNTTGTAGATFTLSVYQGTTCTGTPVFTAGIGVTGVKGSTTVYTPSFPINGFSVGGSTGICYELNAGATGVVQTIGISGYYGQ